MSTRVRLGRVCAVPKESCPRLVLIRRCMLRQGESVFDFSPAMHCSVDTFLTCRCVAPSSNLYTPNSRLSDLFKPQSRQSRLEKVCTGKETPPSETSWEKCQCRSVKLLKYSMSAFCDLPLQSFTLFFALHPILTFLLWAFRLSCNI